nr:penicillin-binding transpeptidase domain-containing protein [Victivallales bacterium]
DYPMGDFACHIVGYLGKEDPSLAENREKFFYYQPDYVGKTGLERLCDRNIDQFGVKIGGLRGAEGYSFVRVDTQGFVNETIETVVPPEHGKNLVLTIDSRAQETAEFAMIGSIGAFVLLDCSNGDVLAMVSSPSFNPGIFIPSVSKTEFSQISQDPRRPFVNRAISSAYTPGSIFKPLIALAMLRSGISPEHKSYCPGYFQVGNQRVRCWRTSGHGELDMREAIAQSCNVFFMEGAKEIGFDRIKALVSEAGIGKKTGFILTESSGVAPSREYKKRTSGENWNVFDTIILSIGQGTILVTPLQVATYMSAIANGGKAFSPRIIKAAYDSSGNLISENTKKDLCVDIKVEPEDFEVVRNGMFDVVNAENGTGKRAASEKIKVFGKTGTAEIKTKDAKRKNTWMAGFAEKDGARYAFAIVVEDGVSGGMTCAPKIKQFFNGWLD